ncbi:hypothetical protein [Pseudomonas sp. NPDC086278]|uniref:hypothetical protein n=1 Tax=Pseudomonas sp. NPDC086278 TaxID=3390646 RepID=UPI003D01E40B
MGNDRTTRVLYPVIIPGLKTPVIHDAKPDGGIPLALFDDFPEGLLCLIDPWGRGTSRSVALAVNDRVDLFVNDRVTAVTGKTIGPGEENDRVRLYLPKGTLRDGINEIFYRVLRPGQTTPTESLKLAVLFHTLAPGAPGHSAHKVQLSSDVLTKGVDRDQAARGVVVGLGYSNRRAHDQLQLSVGAASVEHKVTPAEAAPGSPAVTKTVFTPLFEQIGDNPRTPFQFRIHDQLGNQSGTSATVEVDVHLKDKPVPIDLLKPKVLEAKELGGTRLNFVKDFYEAPFATVQVAYQGSYPGHTVKVYWLGRNNTYGSEIQTVRQAGQTLNFNIPRLEVVDTIGSGAEIYYTVRLQNTTQDLPSKTLDITITGQKHSLPEPTLSTDKLNARTYYPALDGNYEVRLALFGVVTRYSNEIPITQPNYTNIAVPQAWLTENKGRPVLFNYTLKKTGSSEPIIFSWCLRVVL